VHSCAVPAQLSFLLKIDVSLKVVIIAAFVRCRRLRQAVLCRTKFQKLITGLLTYYSQTEVISSVVYNK